MKEVSLFCDSGKKTVIAGRVGTFPIAGKLNEKAERFLTIVGRKTNKVGTLATSETI